MLVSILEIVKRTMKIIIYSIALATLIVCTFAIPARDRDEPGFCHDLDCPTYTTVSKKDGYEVRKYDASRWVGTTITSRDDYKTAVNEGFDRLFDYISKGNKNNTAVPMATPVATKIEPGSNGDNYTVLFFTPFAYKINTPVPNDTRLAIVDLPALTAYAISFPGYEGDNQLKEYLGKLKGDLQKDGMKYVEDYYFTAGYDPPYRFIGRHNEVWLAASN